MSVDGCFDVLMICILLVCFDMMFSVFGVDGLYDVVNVLLFIVKCCV